MEQNSKHRQHSFPHIPWYGGIVILGVIALGLRLWRLGAINELVFDEVYYVKFAVDYLQGEPVFDAHPPLGKYLIAIAIALGQRWATLFNWPQNNGADVWLSPISYRWLNAAVGAMVPLAVGMLAYRLAPSPATSADRRRPRVFALIAAGLMLLEGFTLVESRLALINIYWLIFGILGQAGLMLPGWGWRLGGGIALGAAISVKWNGAAFLLGVWLFWGLSRWRQQLRQVPIAQMGLVPLLLYTGLVPALTYLLLWVPHLLLNPEGLMQLHQQLWQVHQTIAQQTEAHPYCSRWYSWPLMLRPLAYFYSRSTTATGPPVVTDIHGMGNPFGWWLGTAAVVALGAKILIQLRHSPTGGALSPVPVYLLINFGVNWLPWMAVPRCTFLYLYLGALVFAQLSLAWLLTRWYVSGQRLPVYMLLTVVAVGFIFWLPIFLGLPLEGSGFERRMWLPSWI